jgi:hypothetical protein
LKSLPAWAPETCAGCGTVTSLATKLWQFEEQVPCGLSVNVDLDSGDITPYSFYMNARP